MTRYVLATLLTLLSLACQPDTNAPPSAEAPAYIAYFGAQTSGEGAGKGVATDEERLGVVRSFVVDRATGKPCGHC